MQVKTAQGGGMGRKGKERGLRGQEMDKSDD
jgi:hypothetical protein